MSPAAAQRVDAWIDARATHAVPPAGVSTVDAETYGILGARAGVAFGPDAWATAALYGGRAASAADAWFSAFVGGERGYRHGRWLGAIGAEAFALNYTDPFRYAAHGIAIRPRVGAVLGETRVALVGDWRRGRWSAEAEAGMGGVIPGPGGPVGPGGPPGAGETRRTDGSLAVTGAAIRVRRPLGPGRVELAAERLRAENGHVAGVYRGILAGYTFALGRATWRVGGRVRESPGTAGGTAAIEYGFHLGVEVRVAGGLAASADVARGVADPLYGTPGALATGVGVSWHVPVAAPAEPAPVVAVGETGAAGSRVRFRVRAPDATRVELAGDFNGWDPLPMRRAAHGGWVLELTLPAGLHHFAFRIDGQRWYVPDDAPGIVDDGWGRRNASIVIRSP